MIPKPGVAGSIPAGGTTTFLQIGTFSFGYAAISCRIGKIADKLPTRTPITGDYDCVPDGTALSVRPG